MINWQFLLFKKQKTIKYLQQILQFPIIFINLNSQNTIVKSILNNSKLF